MASSSILAAYKATDTAKKTITAAYEDADASVFDNFEAYSAAGNFVSLAQCGSHNKHRHFK